MTTTHSGQHLHSEIGSARAGRPNSCISPQIHWTILRPWQTNTALVVLGVLLLLLSHQLVSEYHHFSIGFSGVSGWQAILYVLSTLIILTQPVDRSTFPIILAVAIGCRLATLFAEPYLSSDIYRYVWDGIVQHAHISPYRYVPGDPALAFLRAPHQAIFDHINRRDYAHTIYPPAAQVLFYLITSINPTVTFMKTVMVLFEGVTMYALIRLLSSFNLRREQVLLYAWCPLLIWEIAGAGHLDSVAMSFITLALLARYRRQPILTGFFLGIAILLKLYPLILLPALLLPPTKPGTQYKPGAPCQAASRLTWGLPNIRNLDWKMPATIAVLITLAYAAYSSVGLLVFGFLGGYAQEEGLATGARYFLLELVQHIPGLHNLPTSAYLLFCAGIFTALTLGTIQSSKLVPGRYSVIPAFALAAALMLLFSPHYPWYVIWLVPFFTLLPNLPILTYLMGFFYLFTTPLAYPGPRMFLLNKILYGAVFLATILHLILQRWPWHRTFFVQPTRASESL